MLQDFHKKYPWISIQHTGAKTDQDIVRAVNSGTAPDMMISAGPDNVAKFCSSGAYKDLNQYLKADGIDLSTIVPEPASRYTSYNGVQCTLPVLSDAYGLYYNTAMFKKAGITAPPKTLSELEADAKKLTVFEPRRVDQGRRLDAAARPSTRARSSTTGTWTGGKWYDAAGKSAFASDPSWAGLLQWQKDFITNVYGADGYTKLQQFFAKLGGPNSEWSTGAGLRDRASSRWRSTVSGATRSSLTTRRRSTTRRRRSRWPTRIARPLRGGADRRRRRRYPVERAERGLGMAAAEVPRAGHPGRGEARDDPEERPDDLRLPQGPEAELGPALQGVPADLREPELRLQSRSRRSATTDSDLWGNFVGKWEAGQVADLQAGLQRLATQIDQQHSSGDGGRDLDGREPRAVAGAPEGAPATLAAARTSPWSRSCRRGSSGSCGSTCTRCSRASTTRSRSTTAWCSLRAGPVLTNYRFMFTQDPFFWQSLRNTIWIVAVGRSAHDPARRRHGVRPDEAAARADRSTGSRSSSRRWCRRWPRRSRSCSC